MHVSFYLKRPKAKPANAEKEVKQLHIKKAKEATAIYARLCYSGYKVKYYIPERINPKFWNKETQRAKETQKFREYPEFNARLNNIEADIKNVFRKYLNDNAGKIPSPDTLKELLDVVIRQKGAPSDALETFFGFFKDFIAKSKQGIRLHSKSGKPLSKNTIKVYNTAYRHLENFQKVHKKKIDFDTIDLDFYSSFTEYLMRGKQLDSKSGQLVPLNLSTNAIGKNIQVIKLVLNEATERGINKNLAYKRRRFISVKEKSDSIYLNEKEIEELEALDLSGNERLERVRDLFLVGCYTGLRYSDYSIIRPDQIRSGFIETVQVKTNDPVVIPIHDSVERILLKYNGQLPKSISNQKTNEYLKEIGKKIDSLKVVTTKTITKAGLKIVKSHKKWEMLSTHTARRSFATNEYLAGTPTITIMAITGHRTEKAFLKYIKLTPNEHAKLLKLHWKKRNEMNAV